jgi:mevalonate kinase
LGKGIGFGKVILFNEHFVVYGLPAIASAIGAKTIALVERHLGSGVAINDERPEIAGYKTEKAGQQKDSLDLMLNFMKIDTKNNAYRLTLGLNFLDDKVNEAAYEGEKGYHGTPSGIDNTAATYGGLIWYKREGFSHHMERMKLKKPVEIVMGNTGLVSDTKAVVGAVKERKEKDPESYASIFKDAERLVHDARRQLEAFHLEEVGYYMDQNHTLLQQIGVSCSELDLLVDVARNNGALGAKLTGTGRGGYMVALTPGKDLQESVAEAIEKKGFQALRTTIGV